MSLETEFPKLYLGTVRTVFVPILVRHPCKSWRPLFYSSIGVLLYYMVFSTSVTDLYKIFLYLWYYLSL